MPLARVPSSRGYTCETLWCTRCFRPQWPAHRPSGVAVCTARTLGQARLPNMRWPASCRTVSVPTARQAASGIAARASRLPCNCIRQIASSTEWVTSVIAAQSRQDSHREPRNSRTGLRRWSGRAFGSACRRASRIAGIAVTYPSSDRRFGFEPRGRSSRPGRGSWRPTTSLPPSDVGNMRPRGRPNRPTTRCGRSDDWSVTVDPGTQRPPGWGDRQSGVRKCQTNDW